MTAPIIINTDGACSGNPGPGGFAAIVEDPKYGHLTITGGDPQTTNNRMELSAVIEALRAINSVNPPANTLITVRSDSEYITKAFNDNWLKNWQRNNWRKSNKKPVENRDLWQELLKETKNHPVTWTWVRGHSGDPQNEECDRLAVAQAAIARNQTEYWCITGNRPLSENPPRMPHPSDPQENGDQPAAPPAQDTRTPGGDASRRLLQYALESLDLGNTADAAAFIRKAMTLLEP